MFRNTSRESTNNMVPYRESKLTSFFKSSFDGEGRIRMILLRQSNSRCLRRDSTRAQIWRIDERCVASSCSAAASSSEGHFGILLFSEKRQVNLTFNRFPSLNSGRAFQVDLHSSSSIEVQSCSRTSLLWSTDWTTIKLFSLSKIILDDEETNAIVLQWSTLSLHVSLVDRSRV